MARTLKTGGSSIEWVRFKRYMRTFSCIQRGLIGNGRCRRWRLRGARALNAAASKPPLGTAPSVQRSTSQRPQATAAPGDMHTSLVSCFYLSDVRTRGHLAAAAAAAVAAAPEAGWPEQQAPRPNPCPVVSIKLWRCWPQTYVGAGAAAVPCLCGAVGASLVLLAEAQMYTSCTPSLTLASLRLVRP